MNYFIKGENRQTEKKRKIFAAFSYATPPPLFTWEGAKSRRGNSWMGGMSD